MARCRISKLAAALFMGAALLPSGSAYAAGPVWSFRGGLLAILEDNGLEGDPSPVLPLPGVALSFPFGEVFAAEPSLDLYSAYYCYSDSLDRPVPCAPEYRSTRVVAAVVGLPLTFTLPLPSLLPGGARVRVLAGPSFDLRLSLVADGLEGPDLEDATAETGKTNAYFWESGRWFLPHAGLGIEFPALKKFWLGGEVRTWFPVYRLWTKDDLPAVEGWRIALCLRAGLR